MENKKQYAKPEWTPPGRSTEDLVSDPFGSYTGRPADPYEVPVQDADDL